jgi:hypothetical protein
MIVSDVMAIFEAPARAGWWLVLEEQRDGGLRLRVYHDIVGSRIQLGSSRRIRGAFQLPQSIVPGDVSVCLSGCRESE